MIKFLKEEWVFVLLIAAIAVIECLNYQDKKECDEKHVGECVQMLVPVDKTGETATVIYYGKE